MHHLGVDGKRVMIRNEEAVLFANDRFYTAFANNDFEAMQNLWGSDGIACAHPGWQALHGRDEVMASWEAILDEAGAPPVRCRSPRATLHGDIAIVICIEELETAYLCATNVFALDAGEWRMIHHHAGPVEIQPKELPDEPDVAVN